MVGDWKKSLTFSDRLSATSKMQEANPGCTSTTASNYAKIGEETARKNASTLGEYHNFIAKFVSLLQSSAPSHSSVEERDIEDDVLPESGVRMGRYERAQHFRNGLFSEVFKAIVPDSARRIGDPPVVALKVTTPSTMVAPHHSMREARILTAAKFQHAIPLIEAFDLAGGRFVLAFPFMPYDLDTLLHRHEALAPVSRREILANLYAGLAELHNHGIIHRDVKPSNILLKTPNGPAYLSDFGIAWSPSDPASEPVDQKILDVGTTCYRPPELLFGHQSYGTKLDIWAAGCVAAQIVCLNKKTLFDAGDLGSELALIKSIFQNLGTPNLIEWPEASSFPDWGKMNFTQYPAKPWHQILPNTEPAAIDLIQNQIVYESRSRLSAQEVLQLPYLQ